MTSLPADLETTFVGALEIGIAEEMRRDERVFCMSTSPPLSLLDEFGPERVRQTPIAESAITGMAIGAAASGQRPVVFWRAVPFSFVAFEQTVNQAARMRYMFGGQCDVPIVFLTSFENGTRSAAQHSQTGYALFAQASGLKIAAPSNPSDAKGLVKTAIRDDNPVVLFYASRLANETTTIPSDGNCVPFASALVRRAGTDVTLVAVAYMVDVALQAAEMLAAGGISVEIIDPRTLVPLDLTAIQDSVRKTGRLVVLDESHPTCSIASEIITSVVEDREAFKALRDPVQRICAAPVPIPFSPVLEDFVLPNALDVEASIRDLMRLS